MPNKAQNNSPRNVNMVEIGPNGLIEGLLVMKSDDNYFIKDTDVQTDKVSATSRLLRRRQKRGVYHPDSQKLELVQNIPANYPTVYALITAHLHRVRINGERVSRFHTVICDAPSSVLVALLPGDEIACEFPRHGKTLYYSLKAEGMQVSEKAMEQAEKTLAKVSIKREKTVRSLGSGYRAATVKFGRAVHSVDTKACKNVEKLGGSAKVLQEEAWASATHAGSAEVEEMRANFPGREACMAKILKTEAERVQNRMWPFNNEQLASSMTEEAAHLSKVADLTEAGKQVPTLEYLLDQSHGNEDDLRHQILDSAFNNTRIQEDLNEKISNLVAELESTMRRVDELEAQVAQVDDEADRVVIQPPQSPTNPSDIRVKDVVLIEATENIEVEPEPAKTKGKRARKAKAS